MKFTLGTLLTVGFLITVLSVWSGSPKPERKIIIHLDEDFDQQPGIGQDYQGIANSLGGLSFRIKIKYFNVT